MASPVQTAGWHLGSRSGFSSETAAESWGAEQEALIRRNMWIDPRDAETPFGEFAEEWYEAVSPRLEPNTRVKYRSYMDNHLLPQWRLWPMIGIFNGYVEIERWLSRLHDQEYAESSIASISTILNAGLRAKIIPANPCHGVRVTGGEFENERLLATPVQVLRAAMRLYESEMGLSGFTLSARLLHRRPVERVRWAGAARVRRGRAGDHHPVPAQGDQRQVAQGWRRGVTRAAHLKA